MVDVLKAYKGGVFSDVYFSVMTDTPEGEQKDVIRLLGYFKCSPETADAIGIGNKILQTLEKLYLK